MKKEDMRCFEDKINKKIERINGTLGMMKDFDEANMEEHAPELSNYDNHPADLGTDLYSLEMNLALKVHEQNKLNKLQHALKKIDDGTYGKCEHCGKEIDSERLETIPEANFCIQCERDAEASRVDTPDQQFDEVFDAPFGRKYLNKREDDEFEGMDQLNDLMKYGSADTPSDLGGYCDYEEYYTNEIDNQGIVEEVDKISNQQYKDQLP